MTARPTSSTPPTVIATHPIARSQRPSGPEALAGQRVLVVGINYWPEPTGIAPYTTAMAEHLAQRVAAVQVVAGLPSYPTWTVPAEYRQGLRHREVVGGVTLTRVAHVVPNRQDALRRGAYELSFFANAATVPIRPKPSLVIGVSPALGGAAAAARLAARCHAPLVVIVQDLLGQAATQSGVRGGRRVAGVVRRLESATLRRAAAVVVVSDAFRAGLEAYGVEPARVHTLANWSRTEFRDLDRAETRARLGWRPEETVVLHTGNMGYKQDLGNVVAAARITRTQPDLRWALMGDGSQRAALARQAAGLPNLQFLPLCEPAEYGPILVAADILLLNERPSVEEMSLPSKLTSYFSSGRPVAAAVHSGGAAGRELARAGAPSPVPPGEPHRLVALVRELADSPALREHHGRTARDYAELELAPVVAMRRLESILGHVLADT